MIVLGKAGGIQAMPVHWRGLAPGAGGFEAAPRHQVARVFEGKGVAGIQQQPCAQVDGLLRAMYHQNLLGLAGQSPGTPQVTLEGASQRCLTFGRGIRQAALLTQQFGLVGTPPGQGRKVPGSHRPIQEVEANRFSLQRCRHGESRHAAPEFGQGWGRPGVPACGQPGWCRCSQRAGDSGHTPHRGDEEALGHKLFVGGGDGGTRYPQLGRQRSRGRRPGARRQCAIRDLAAKEIVDAASRARGSGTVTG
ncbi:hypothetical protein D9M72_299270 [compost metagenome]